ncbi:hypothetical protein K493DRAFT_385158 [Basidiobolus meristosporus CBS 931.73]|uniref:Uncharacterized protein n=1 Tax=Basidiobolus meristosporus CBS 931.73 TaxID=1314790 RepID=A0A1Y1XRR6_9FUNG|nr:hypothetical protein K493DRAFT_385158 [Basidiobolus meristosporus CBS 931.73]|eukprot:ORX88459.1 hypothetical protein K493DRAFT_385158 [Basidiobolus meristosporus CBS 931.73]
MRSTALSLLLLVGAAYALPVPESSGPQILESEAWSYEEEFFGKRAVYEGTSPAPKAPASPSQIRPSQSSLDSQSERATTLEVPCTGVADHFGHGIVAAVCTEQLGPEMQEFS